MQGVIHAFGKVGESGERLRTARPSFSGLVRGELLKIRNQRTTWILAVLVLLLVMLPYLITYLSVKPDLFLQRGIFNYFCAEMIGLMRAWTGFYLLILTARVIGLEYQLGTIRVLLARGVGRLQLLLAKLTALTLVALLLLLSCLVMNAVMLGGALAWHGSLNLLLDIKGDLVLYVLTVLISTVASLLLATAATVLGRSLAFGLSAALVFFPLDNFGALLLPLGYRLTHSDFWPQITAYLLGPNLNQMSATLTGHPGFNLGFGPAIDVDGMHTLLVALFYVLAFVVLAVVLTVRRDVHE
ncbi:MAG TPA: ABC transporter permease subunit [Ktedonobacteraceae bacterium]